MKIQDFEKFSDPEKDAKRQQIKTTIGGAVKGLFKTVIASVVILFLEAAAIWYIGNHLNVFDWSFNQCMGFLLIVRLILRKATVSEKTI